MQDKDNQQFEAQSTPNESSEPTVDCSTQKDESFEEVPISDKMADKELQDWQDKYLRLSAEFDNFRKRTLREKIELAESGGSDVLKVMLGTADDFDRALSHITSEADRAGVEIIYNKFLASLRAKGVVEMDLVGKAFDVDFAEAIAKFPATNKELSGTVMEIAEKGYMLKDKVLRFAKVVVFE